MDAAITVEGLHVRYRRGLGHAAVHALRGLDLTVARGEIVGVLGPNGSGKTSLLEVLAGTRRPHRGRVQLLGRAPTDRALVGRVGLQPVGKAPFADLGPRRLLRLQASLSGMPQDRAARSADLLLEQVGLAGVADRRSRGFSTGMQRRLLLASALLTEPEVLLLDEPTSGLDPSGSLVVRDRIAAAAAAGTTVLMASHDLQEIEQLCGRVYVLVEGECRAAGALDDLLGTDAHELVVRGLDDAGLARSRAAIQAAGGEVIAAGRQREHLFALFRRLTQDPDASA